MLAQDRRPTLYQSEIAEQFTLEAVRPNAVDTADADDWLALEVQALPLEREAPAWRLAWGDFEAWDIVVQLAYVGSALHVKALSLLSDRERAVIVGESTCTICGSFPVSTAHIHGTCGWCDRCGRYHLAELDCAPLSATAPCDDCQRPVTVPEDHPVDYAYCADCHWDGRQWPPLEAESSAP